MSIGTFKRLWAEMVVHDTTAHKDVLFSTADPSTSNHLFVDSQQMPLGKPVDIGALLPCGKTVEYAWEDAEGTTNWALQDESFDVSITCAVPNPHMMHLTR